MKRIAFLFSLVFVLSLNAQKQGNIWYFADSCGLDFNSGSPVALNNGNIFSSNVTEGTSSICDSSGSLLFYANGAKAWNRNHQVMPNGNGLMGGASSTQGALIIPWPGNDSLFYLFTTDEFQHDLQNGLRYSVISICRNNGLGDIIPNQKNILLLDTVAEKLTATLHANGTDIWLVTHKFFSDAFYAYRISPAGIVDTVVSYSGNIHIDWNQPSNCGPAIGQMKISPDGSKLALAFGNANPCDAELFDFDNATGMVTNAIDLPPDSYDYGVAFSPDNSKLYFSTLGSHTVFQYDLSAGNASQIIASKTLIYDNSSPPMPLSGMQLGPDGKIYVTDNYYMDVISNPNAAGLACNYIHNAVYLGGHRSDYGITNFMEGYAYHNTVPKCEISSVNDPSKETANGILVFPNPAGDLIHFQFSTDLNWENTELVLVDVLGREIKTQAIQSGTVLLQRENLPAGMYQWIVRSPEKIIGSGKLAIE